MYEFIIWEYNIEKNELAIILNTVVTCTIFIFDLCTFIWTFFLCKSCKQINQQ